MPEFFLKFLPMLDFPHSPLTNFKEKKTKTNEPTRHYSVLSVSKKKARRCLPKQYSPTGSLGPKPLQWKHARKWTPRPRIVLELVGSSDKQYSDLQDVCPDTFFPFHANKPTRTPSTSSPIFYSSQTKFTSILITISGDGHCVYARQEKTVPSSSSPTNIFRPSCLLKLQPSPSQT